MSDNNMTTTQAEPVVRTEVHVSSYSKETTTFENDVKVRVQVDYFGKSGRGISDPTQVFDASGNPTDGRKTYLNGIIEKISYSVADDAGLVTRTTTIIDLRDAEAWTELSSISKSSDNGYWLAGSGVIDETSLFEELGGSSVDIQSYWTAQHDDFRFHGSHRSQGSAYSISFDDGSRTTKVYGRYYDLLSDETVDGVTGVSITTAYGYGQRVSVTLQDPVNARGDFASQVTTLENDRVTKLEIRRDDGTRVTTDYVEGTDVTRTTNDEGNLHGWTTNAVTLGADGRPVTATTVNDDGSVAVTKFAHGIRSHATIDRDGADGKVGSVLTFDGYGALARSVVTSADKLVTATSYFGGAINEKTVVDTGDAFIWTRHVASFDAEGHKTSTLTSYDKGSSVLTEFANGVRRRQTIDRDESAGGIDCERRFDRDGALIGTEWTTGKGVVVKTEYDAGQLELRTITDGADAFVFETTQQTFENGRMVSAFTMFDSGLVRDVTLENAIVVRRAFTDIGDDFRWQSRAFALDGQGSVTGMHTVWDDATVTQTGTFL